MKSNGQSTSVRLAPQFLRWFGSRGIIFIIAALFALGVVCPATPGLALAQGPPEWAQDGHSSGLSPLVDDSEDGTPVTVTGVLTILHADDFVNKRGKFFYHLKEKKTNKTFNLRFAKKAPPGLSTGAIVTVRGKAKGQEIFLALDQSGGESIQTVLPAIAAVAGEQKTIVMVVNFLDASVSCSVDAVQDLMFTDPYDKSIDDLYQETSIGNVWFSGNIVGPFTINYRSAGTCDHHAWAAAAEAAAQSDGLNLGVYDRKVYVLPKENPCSWAGLATLGGSPSQAWIFLCDAADVYGHEIGHNLGMNHAATPNFDYGDVSDIMGLSGYGLRRVNAPHHEQMGWFSPDHVLTITAGGIYDLAPLEVDPSNALDPQILKIAKPDTGEYYYLSYRQQLGFDATLNTYYLDGLNVHRYKGDASASRTYFLDVLADGESFVDSANGITVTQMSHNNDYLTLQVEFDGVNPTCTVMAPTMSVSPQSQGGAAGTTLAYAVSVSNADSANCEASAFSLDRNIPGGWTGTFSTTTLILLPGQTGQATLYVTSADDAFPTTYGLSLVVSDASEPTHNISANAIYVVNEVSPDDAEPPTPPTGLSASLKGKNVKLSWNEATDNLGVAGYTVWRDGTSIGDVTETSYVDDGIISGVTYTYWVEAYDGAGNSSGPSNLVTLTVKNASVKDNTAILPSGRSKKK